MSAPRARSTLAPDPVWEEIRNEVGQEAEREPILASFLHATVLNHDRLEDALGFLLAGKLESPTLPAMLLREVMDQAMAEDDRIAGAVRADLHAARTRDPACTGLCVPLLYGKGFHALESFRVAHWLYGVGRLALALHLQNRISEVFSVDIHPAARIGQGILIDHGTSVVIGETAVVADDVSMLHEVTLGGTGKALGDRHPKIGRGVLLSTGAKVLGNVVVGEGAKVGAGSVVLEDVPPHVTVAGVPAQIVGTPEADQPALEMDHQLPLPGTR